jgi:hypothetical protein
VHGMCPMRRLAEWRIVCCFAKATWGLCVCVSVCECVCVCMCDVSLLGICLGLQVWVRG